MQVSACSLDIMFAEGTLTPVQHMRGNKLLERVVSILTRSIMNLQKQQGLDAVDHDDHDHDHDVEAR